MPAELTELFKHNLWANLKILDYIEKLSDEQLDETFTGTYGSIRSTILHIVGAEEGYAARATGTPRPPYRSEEDAFPGFDNLRAALAGSGQLLIDAAAQNHIVDKYDGQDPDGTRFEVAGVLYLLQAINHATEHRSQINTVLTNLGIPPLDLDGWAYGEEAGLFTLL